MQTQTPRIGVIVAATLLCGACIGYFMGRISSAPPSTVVENQASENPNRSPDRVEPTSADAPSSSSEDPSLVAKSLSERLAKILRQPSGRWRSRQIALLADEIPVGEIPTFLSKIQTDSTTDSQELRQALLARWAELDPKAATLHALEFDASSRWFALNATIGEWIAQDANTASAWARSLPSGAIQDSAISAVVRALSRRDPKAAFELMSEFPRAESQLHDVQEVMARWAQEDPVAAAAALGSLKQPAVAGRAVINVARGWAQVDPADAFAWAAKVENKEHRRQAFPIVLKAWAERDPRAALVAVQSMPEGPERELALGAVANGLAATDPDRAMALVSELPNGPARDFSLGQLAGALASKDPIRAAELVQSLPAGLADAAIRDLVPRLESAHRAKAAELALRLGDQTSRSHMVSKSVLEWMRTSPDEAIAWLQAKKLDGRLSSDVRVTLNSWAAENADAAATLLRKYSAASNSAGVIWDGVLSGLARNQPRIAADLALTQHGNTSSAHTLYEIGQALAKSDTAASTAWLMKLPDSDARMLAAVGVTSAWAEANPQSPAVWIESLPAGNLRDGAALGYARQIARIDPVASLSWAETVSATPLRDEVMSGTLASWIRQDPSAANAWLSKNPNLPESVQKVVDRLKKANP